MGMVVWCEFERVGLVVVVEGRVMMIFMDIYTLFFISYIS